MPLARVPMPGILYLLIFSVGGILLWVSHPGVVAPARAPAPPPPPPPSENKFLRKTSGYLGYKYHRFSGFMYEEQPQQQQQPRPLHAAGTLRKKRASGKGGRLDARTEEEEEDRLPPGGDVSKLPGCPGDKKDCGEFGHPEICCLAIHTCLPTNNTLTGVYCCRSEDPEIQPCDDTILTCDPGWYECPASMNGGCCKYGQRCGQVECFDGGGPSSPVSTPETTLSTTSSYIADLDGDGLSGDDDDSEVLRTTVSQTYTENEPSTTAPLTDATIEPDDISSTTTAYNPLAPGPATTKSTTVFDTIISTTAAPNLGNGAPFGDSKLKQTTKTAVAAGRKVDLEYSGWCGVIRVWGLVAVVGAVGIGEWV